MKPSKIISEKETKFPYDEGHKRDFRSCLLEYLDEEHERKHNHEVRTKCNEC